MSSGPYFHVFSIFDSAAQAYMRPFFERNAATARRAFASAVNTPGSDMNLNRADLTLFEIGLFYEDKGHVEPLNTPHRVAGGVEVFEQDQTANPSPTPMPVKGGE